MPAPGITAASLKPRLQPKRHKPLATTRCNPNDANHGGDDGDGAGEGDDDLYGVTWVMNPIRILQN